jgi:hypothetical protein
VPAGSALFQCIASPLVGAVGDVDVDVAAVAASTTGRATPTTTLPACDARRPMPSATRCNGGAGGGSGCAMPRRSSTARRTPATSRWPRATKTVSSEGPLSRRYAATPNGA